MDLKGSWFLVVNKLFILFYLFCNFKLYFKKCYSKDIWPLNIAIFFNLGLF